MQEEIFGPVVCVSPFQEEEEVINRVNNTRWSTGWIIPGDQKGVISGDQQEQCDATSLPGDQSPLKNYGKGAQS